MIRQPKPDHFDPSYYPWGYHEIHMLSHDWPESPIPQRPRFFLTCGTCGAMFLTAFRFKFCRVCWLTRDHKKESSRT